MTKHTTKTLFASIAAFAKTQAKFHDDAHKLACDTLEHAAETRDIRPLQRFYDVLSVNYQTALRVWINGIQQANDGKAKFLKFTTEEGFSVLPPSDAEKVMLADIPKLRKGKHFYVRDVRGAPDMLTDETFMRQAKALLARATKDGAHVSKVLVEPLRNVVTLAEARVAQMKAEPVVKPQAAPKAKAKAKAKAEIAKAA